ncbi:MAG: dTDP-4-dehydrorhamnose 3,5-epimerase [Pirellulales bacterium]
MPIDWTTLTAASSPLRPQGEAKTSVALAEIGVVSDPASANSLRASVFAVGGVSFAALGDTGVTVIEPRVFGDHRGFFLESYHAEKYAAAGIAPPFVQDNHSRSTANVLRGLHYQIRRAQGKLVRAVRGAIYDVAVDLRKSSPTFGRWFGVVLDDRAYRMLYVPPGFGHGFCTRTDDTEVIYKCTDLYAPAEERTVLWNDPTLNVSWPVVDPILAEKDRAGKSLGDAELYE